MDISAKRKNFIRYLNRNYCLTLHLAERLDEVQESTLFLPVSGEIHSAIQLLEAQAIKLGQLYQALDITVSFDDSRLLIAFLEHTFSCLSSEHTGAQFLCLLDYVSAADLLMASSARLAVAWSPKPELLERSLYKKLTMAPLIRALERSGMVLHSKTIGDDTSR